MKLRVLGCYGGELPDRRLPGFLIDDTLLVDAGSVTSVLPLTAQARIDHVLVSHAHLNHVVSLAFLIDNVVSLRTSPVKVWSTAPILQNLRDHLFNNILWPDFTCIPSSSSPILSLRTLQAGRREEIGRFQVTAIPVHHPVATVGFILDGEEGSLVYTGDTGPTEQIWEAIRSLPSVRALIVETSFPNRLDAVAVASGHLTPHKLALEIQKVPTSVPVYIYHIKPQFLEEVIQEISRTFPRPFTLLEDGKTYSF